MAFTLRYSVLLVDHAVSTRELITIVRLRRSRIPPNDWLSQIPSTHLKGGEQVLPFHSRFYHVFEIQVI